MRNRHTLVMAGWLLSALAGSAAALASDQEIDNAIEPESVPRAACDQLEACVELLIQWSATHEDTSGMDEAGSKLASRISDFPGAADAMVPLLSHENEALAEVAGYVLRDIDHIDPAHLPAIVAGLERGLGWLPPALARIGTDEAARIAVVQALESDSFPHNQEVYAIRLLKEKAVSHIVAAARCGSRCPEQEHFYQLGVLLGETGAGVAAAPELVMLASDPAAPLEQVEGLLQLVGAIGIQARPWQGDLVALAATRPEVAPAVEATLVAIGADQAGQLLADQLRRTEDSALIVDIAELGPLARSAAPALLEMLENSDWELRYLAVRALGYVYEPSAAPALQSRLFDPRDVRANWAAAEALSRLRVDESRKDLAKAATSHWHPSVRAAAGRALEALDAPVVEPSKEAPFDRWAFFFGMRDPPPVCERVLVDVASEPADRKLYATEHSGLMAPLSYTAITVGFGAPEDAEPDEDGIIEVTPENVIRYETPHTQIPDVALRVDGGWLAGADRGEWVGDLMWLGDDGERYEVLDDNVEDIYRLGDRIVAVTGTAHLITNSGMLYELDRERAAGRWRATPWRALPGAPYASWLTPDGRLLVGPVGHGAVLIDPSGEMSLAECIPVAAEGE